MVCHCNRLPNDSLVQSEKKGTSSGNKRPCTKLWATLPPWPWAQALMLADAGKGLSPNLKVGCQIASGLDEDAMSISTLADGRGPPIGSWIITLPQGGVFEGASLGTLGGWSPMRCFFFGRLMPGGGGCGPYLEAGPWVECRAETGQRSFFACSP